MSVEGKQRGAHLAEWKKQEAKRTEEQLGEALDRFESCDLLHLPKGTKLTRLNLALEAEVSKDTPFSRYRAGHPNAGEYRFPKIVNRFIRLRRKRSPKVKEPTTGNEVKELKAQVEELKMMLSASRSVVNAQDIQIDDLKRRCQDLEELSTMIAEERDNLEAEFVKLRRQRIREVPSGKQKK
jgi:hypothetical protein